MKKQTFKRSSPQQHPLQQQGSAALAIPQEEHAELAREDAHLSLEGLREHNLKNLHLDIPHDKLVLVTGLSGSGKSSLAFSSIYAEGQRRYIETFSPYTRQFFEKIKKPDLDSARGVRPSLAIEQKTRIRSSRSTVGSLTDINDYLRVYWAIAARAHCPACSSELLEWTDSELVNYAKEFLRSRKAQLLYICAPVQLEKKYRAQELERFAALGYLRFWEEKSKSILRIDDDAKLLPKSGSLVLVLDRFRQEDANKKESEKRLLESLLAARNLAQKSFQLICIDEEGSATIQQCTGQYYCKSCETSFAELPKKRPSLFSYNHPFGACPECKGFGYILGYDPKKIIPNGALSLKNLAIAPWASEARTLERRKLLQACMAQDIPLDEAWNNLEKNTQDFILHGKTKGYLGVVPWLKRLEAKIYKMHVRVFLSRYREQYLCPACEGSRLRKEAHLFRIGSQHIGNLWEMPIEELHRWVLAETEEKKIGKKTQAQARMLDLLTRMQERAQSLIDLGLPYLSLSRQARTLSGGETQRVHLATAIGSGLVSTQFVLDEPSVGLHARDTERLIHSLRKLQGKGNSVLVVEHDLDCLANADHIIEIGPEAGNRAGEIEYSGEIGHWSAKKLQETLPKRTPPSRASQHTAPSLHIRQASLRNIRKLSLDIPLGRLVALSGVSGSGKSTLLEDILYESGKAFFLGDTERSRQLGEIQGFEHFQQVLLVDQSPLAKSPRANIGTYTGIWEYLRNRFAQTELAKAHGLSKSHFSFNVDGGRCTACQGAGFLREDMQFLSDVYIPCEVCLGKRFSPQVLDVQFLGKSVDEYLRSSIEDLRVSLRDEKNIASALHYLCKLGLGHLQLGHSLSELSGGEAQRLKLLPFLDKSLQAKSLLLFDEPSTGLHLHDVHILLALFAELIEQGHSIICVEHNPLILLASDWIIDLGPEGGDGGGQVVLVGNSEDFLAQSAIHTSETARCLQDYVKRFGKGFFPAKAKKAFSTKSSKPTHLVLRGAREHNLKNIDLDIPLGSIVALTGVSGSGKSSIAKDIIYAEGQRRFLDCLSPYARQFINEIKKPELDSIENVQPTICVHQHTFQPSRLSTVGTLSEVYNFLRLLLAKLGSQYCPDHPEQVIASFQPETLSTELQRMFSGTVRILVSVIHKRKGVHREIFEQALSKDIHEVRVDGVLGKTSHFLEGLEKNKVHSIEYVLGKCNPQNVSPDILAEMLRQGLSLGSGTLIIEQIGKDYVMSTERACPVCRRGFYKPDPEDLSFHSKRGRCQRCDGTGETGSGRICQDCAGARIGEVGRNIRFGGQNIFELASKQANELLELLRHFEFRSAYDEKLAKPILRELIQRLECLVAMGLEYLPLTRDCRHLSGGELQRLRLSAAIGSPLSGAMYIFDEPSAGLHPLDNTRVLDQLRRMHALGNSILLIEHDRDTILFAEHVIDIGPGGGAKGGQVVFSGSREEFLQSDTVTAQELRLPHVPASPRKSEGLDKAEHFLELKNCSKNTIHQLHAKIPLLSCVGVAGVSGSGKSSLVHGIIVDTLVEGKEKTLTWTHHGNTIRSSCSIDRVLFVDQQPIGKNSRSTPASYLGIWDEIRKLFAGTLEAKSRGWTNSHFSHNAGKGRCPTCAGQGVITVEMSFLADAKSLCEACGGSRYKDELQSVRYLEKSISEVLALTFDEARLLFANHRKIHQLLQLACELGLGYLTLGQASPTLSGGESQRIKLVAELGGKRSGHTLYVLDEPSTGLHKADVRRLVRTLHQLRDMGNSVIVIEHDEDILGACDSVVEMGPGAGEGGGKVLKGK